MQPLQASPQAEHGGGMEPCSRCLMPGEALQPQPLKGEAACCPRQWRQATGTVVSWCTGLARLSVRGVMPQHILGPHIPSRVR